ncbi:VOC family protein [Catellatospora coxensis]
MRRTRTAPATPTAAWSARTGSTCCSFRFRRKFGEPRTGHHRMHLDLMPTVGTRNEEVERLLGLGATLVGDHRKPDGTGWVVLADPEGNEFCVERSPAERTSAI